MTIRVALVTVSDGVAAGQREDLGGRACERALAEAGLDMKVVSRDVLPDERREIKSLLEAKADSGDVDLVVFTGGTGVAPRDRTPDAVRAAIEFEVPGLAEKMRAETGAQLPVAYLSRQLVGVRGATLVVTLPGSPKGASDCLRAIADLLPHAVALIRGERHEHPATRKGPAPG
jgi:molybdenum cofactor synthesis domain-containing protein